VSKNKLTMEYVIPKHLCHIVRQAQASDAYYLDLGAILAIADEVTTALLVCCDSDYRPGHFQHTYFYYVYMFTSHAYIIISLTCDEIYRCESQPIWRALFQYYDGRSACHSGGFHN
jgi:hypothetical protein